MASFLEELWNSVLTPGPTSTLLAATNATFACLQLLLFVLLTATRSVHFVVLSFLCGGLWWSVNWFVRELATVKAQEGSDENRPKGKGVEVDKIPHGDSDTETEPSGGREKPRPTRESVISTNLKPSGADESLRKRHSTGDGSGYGSGSGYISTDSEWEKVSENSEKGAQ